MAETVVDRPVHSTESFLEVTKRLMAGQVKGVLPWSFTKWNDIPTTAVVNVLVGRDEDTVTPILRGLVQYDTPSGLVIVGETHIQDLQPGPIRRHRHSEDCEVFQFDGERNEFVPTTAPHHAFSVPRRPDGVIGEIIAFVTAREIADPDQDTPVIHSDPSAMRMFLGLASVGPIFINPDLRNALGQYVAANA